MSSNNNMTCFFRLPQNTS